MALEGEVSEKSCMRCGVPQGTVLDPLCFLFVNDIGNDITSNIKLFADDTLLFNLQSDLDKLVEWAKLWQMAVNPSKCYVLRVCRTKCPLIYTPIHCAWPYPTSCRPLSLPRSFSVREPKLQATYPKHYKQRQFDTWLCEEELASLPTES